MGEHRFSFSIGSDRSQLEVGMDKGRPWKGSLASVGQRCSQGDFHPPLLRQVSPQAGGGILCAGTVLTLAVPGW